MKIRMLPSLALALLASTASAQSSLGTANSFNVFVFGTGTANSGEAEGAVAAGGTLTLNGYNTTILSNEMGVVGGLTKSDNSTGTLNHVSIYAGGAFNYSSVNVNSSGNAYVHGNLNAGNQSNFNGGGKLYSDKTGVYPAGYSYAVDPSVFSNQQSFSLVQSSQLSTSASTTNAAFQVVDQNSWTFDASTQTGSVKYVSVDAATLGSLQGTTLRLLNLKDTDTLVINVTGSHLSQTFFSLSNDKHNNYFANVLWNFASTDANAEFDISQRAFDGSLLAPSALVDQNQLFEGNLIANNWVGHGYEDHLRDNFKFNGVLSTASAVPEPGNLAMAGGLLLGGLGFLACRGKRLGRGGLAVQCSKRS